MSMCTPTSASPWQKPTGVTKVYVWQAFVICIYQIKEALSTWTVQPVSSLCKPGLWSLRWRHFIYLRLKPLFQQKPVHSPSRGLKTRQKCKKHKNTPNSSHRWTSTTLIWNLYGDTTHTSCGTESASAAGDWSLSNNKWPTSIVLFSLSTVTSPVVYRWTMSNIHIRHIINTMVLLVIIVTQ